VVADITLGDGTPTVRRPPTTKGFPNVRIIHSLKARREQDGFTLIELMVVVLIIAILIAIAIPTFLSARESAQNRAAQSDLRNALIGAKTHYTNEESYTALDAAALEALEPSLEYVDGAGTQAEVGVDSTDDTTTLMKESKTGEFYAICESVADGSEGTTYGEGADSATAAGCTLGTEGW